MGMSRRQFLGRGGALLGGLALGVVETFGAAYVSVVYKDAFAFVLLILFLLLRPQGLIPSRVRQQELRKGVQEDMTIEDVNAETTA